MSLNMVPAWTKQKSVMSQGKVPKTYCLSHLYLWRVMESTYRGMSTAKVVHPRSLNVAVSLPLACQLHKLPNTAMSWGLQCLLKACVLTTLCLGRCFRKWVLVGSYRTPGAGPLYPHPAPVKLSASWPCPVSGEISRVPVTTKLLWHVSPATLNWTLWNPEPCFASVTAKGNQTNASAPW